MVSFSHFLVSMWLFLGGAHQNCVGGARKTILRWNQAIGNLSIAIRKDILNCHLPKSPTVDLSRSSLAPGVFSKNSSVKSLDNLIITKSYSCYS